MLETSNDLVTVHFSVTNKLVPFEIGRQVIQVKADHCFQTAPNTRLNKTGNSQLQTGGNPGFQRNFVQVARCVLQPVIIQEKAVDQPPTFGWIKIFFHPLSKSTGVIAEIKIRVSRHPTLQRDGQIRGDDGYNLPVSKFKFQVRQIVPEQRGLSTSQEEIDNRLGLFQNGHLETLYRAFATKITASQS